jgi:hypothetical protein
MLVSVPCHEHPGLVSNVVLHVCAENVDLFALSFAHYWQNPSALASPGIYIPPSLLSVLKHGCLKYSPDFLP